MFEMSHIKYCKNPDCRLQFNDTSENHDEEYCIGCKMKIKKQKPKKTNWSNISIKFAIKKQLIMLQNKILKKMDKKVGFSDLIEYLFTLSAKSGSIVDNIIDIIEGK